MQTAIAVYGTLPNDYLSFLAFIGILELGMMGAIDLAGAGPTVMPSLFKLTALLATEAFSRFSVDLFAKMSRSLILIGLKRFSADLARGFSTLLLRAPTSWVILAIVSRSPFDLAFSILFSVLDRLLELCGRTNYELCFLSTEASVALVST